MLRIADWPATLVGVGLTVIIFLGAAALWPDPKPAPGSARPVPPTVVESEAGPKVPMVPKGPVRVLPPKVKPKLGLPATVQDDPNKWLLGTGTILGSRDGYQVSAVYDDDTGETAIYSKPEPAPWLGKADETALALGYVIKDSGQTWRLKARRDVVRVKDLYGYVEGQLDSDGDRSVGAYLEWRL